MPSRLERINDWEKRADASHYEFDEFVKVCSTSRSQIRRYFLVAFGETPQKWMDEVRLAAAADLLRKSDLSVKQIATKLYYTYPGNFARQFKRRYGCTPSNYAIRNEALSLERRQFATSS